MPEGDTLFVTARVLHRALAGARVERVLRDERLGRRCDFAGRVVERVEARGKNLLVFFDDGRALRTHLRMSGEWHVYRPGEAWRHPAFRARIALETAEWTAVCFHAPVVEELRPGEADIHPPLATLGPDVLRDDFDAAAARENLQARGATPLGVALLDQRAVAGIGNIWRCETLHRLALDPFRPVGERDDATLDLMLATARDLMRASVEPYGRRPTFAVHDRSGAPCPRCADRVRSRVVGDPPRHLYFCPGCQLG
jgi:endonuclease-8